MKKMMLKSVLILQLLLLTITVESQQVEAISKIDRDSILVGQPIRYELSMRVPHGFKIEWPFLEDTLSRDFEIINTGEIKQAPYDADSNVLFQQVLNITSFTPGDLEIPPVKLSFLPVANDSLFFTIETQSHPVYVHTISVDTTETFMPIKGPIGVSNFEVITEFIKANYLWLLLALMIMGLLIIMIYYYKQKRKKAGEEDLKKPKIPPHITALKALEELKNSKLWQQGKVKQYYTLLTGIVRSYIEEQFGVLAIEMTTEEILSEIETLNFDSEISNELANVLHIADFVKFAKMDPAPQENETCFEYSLDFVNKTTALKQALEVAAKKATEEQKIQSGEKMEENQL